ncbi:alpha-2-macroglobulin-like [Sceloporus undulatus]|uniref:alpha-2-macroglobulin-like n=1 Tax=Sceloporus undulatus TaxID=8520 RepID=UPI001C4CF3B2|nr:alpha-2-macroglobulin-like [Sceloporus undulatus]
MGQSWFLGGPSIFLLLLFLLPGSTSASTAEPQYVVLVPSLIHTEITEKICVQLSHLNESVTLSITLDYGGHNESLVRTVVTKTDDFQCIPFMIPTGNSTTNSPVVLLTVSVKGETLSFWSRKRVLVKNMDSLVFVQTDKPIYKPGQEVQFRIASLDEDFHPVNEKFPLVYIQDPKRNRLYQWQDVELQVGLTQLSFPLTSEPTQGTYKVVVKKSSGKNVEHPFEVKEYVLPKFEVVVKVPKIITIMSEEMEVTVCGMYTYGKPVPGLVKARVCRRYSESRSQCYGKESEGVCEEFSGQADGHGCLSQVVQTKVFQLKRSGYRMNIEVEGKIVEEGTEMELTGSASTDITQTLSKVTLKDADHYYKPGIPYEGQVKLVDGTNQPIANKTITITVGAFKANYTTDALGQAEFSIDTTNFTHESINVQAQYKAEASCYDRNWKFPIHQSAYQRASLFYSPSQSYIHILTVSKTLQCGEHHPVQVRYALNLEVIKQEKIVFHYLVAGKGRIVQDGTYILPETHREAKGIFSLDMTFNIHAAPLARLLLYTILPNGELVADSYEINIENCFLNKVKLWFTDPTGLPSSDTQLHLAASEGSLCAIHAVDKSVFLLKPEAELSSQTVYNLLPVKMLSGYYYESWNVKDHDDIHCVPYKTIVVDGIRYQPDTYSPESGYAYTIIEVSTSGSLKWLWAPKTGNWTKEVNEITPVQRQMPLDIGEMEWSMLHSDQMTLYPSGVAFSQSAPVPAHALAGENYRIAEGYSAMESQDDQPQETVRKFFPETWLWDIYVVKNLGQDASEITVPVTIPDTITEWRAGAYCMSADTGFGLASTTTLTAFKPFFLDFTMPYSVVRGEAFVLKATASTYLQSCIRVKILLDPSPDFEASPVEKEEESYCLCANGRKTVSWTVTPKSLGEVNFTASAEALKSDAPCGNEVVETPSKGQKDTVIKPLLVEPEGVEKELVFSHFLCNSKNPPSEDVSLKVPENVVEGSARASFCVLGDILGNAIQNLHQLLRMPYGCGEQNMALFAPNIYILNYLNNTGQLTEEIKSKAIGYLVSGYQRQLNYKHSDGSYSTFGERYQEPGNAWLTAFVLKSFAQAQHHIFLEQNHIRDAQAWLAVRQKENGCFRSSGTLLNNALKGGVDDEVSLSAYIAIALLEIPLPVTHSVVRNALFCLETAAESKEIHVYTRALMAYAFALAGKEEKREEMLRLLNEVAVNEDNSLHWQRPKKQEEEKDDLSYYHPPAPSAEVEMTSYVLLAYLTKRPAPSEDDLATATRIVLWLIKQANPTGGFSSTQDTVVALQALSLYGSSTFAKSSTAVQATLKSGENVLKQFQVEKANRLLLQCQSVPELPGDYHIEVAGEGCVYAQTTLRYNVQPVQEDAPFALEVHTVPKTCTGHKAHKTFDLAINVSYTGKRLVSNMAIVDVKMLSGFIPVKPSVKKLENQNQIKRTEVSTTHVLLYLEKVTNTTQSYTFTVEQDVPVQGLKPALVKVYDYYETDEFAVKEYSGPCSADGTKNGNA